MPPRQQYRFRRSLGDDPGDLKLYADPYGPESRRLTNELWANWKTTINVALGIETNNNTEDTQSVNVNEDVAPFVPIGKVESKDSIVVNDSEGDRESNSDSDDSEIEQFIASTLLPPPAPTLLQKPSDDVFLVHERTSSISMPYNHDEEVSDEAISDENASHEDISDEELELEHQKSRYQALELPYSLFNDQADEVETDSEEESDQEADAEGFGMDSAEILVLSSDQEDELEENVVRSEQDEGPEDLNREEEVWSDSNTENSNPDQDESDCPTPHDTHFRGAPIELNYNDKTPTPIQRSPIVVPSILKPNSRLGTPQACDEENETVDDAPTTRLISSEEFEQSELQRFLSAVLGSDPVDIDEPNEPNEPSEPTHVSNLPEITEAAQLYSLMEATPEKKADSSPEFAVELAESDSEKISEDTEDAEFSDILHGVAVEASMTLKDAHDRIGPAEDMKVESIIAIDLEDDSIKNTGLLQLHSGDTELSSISNALMDDVEVIMTTPLISSENVKVEISFEDEPQKDTTWIVEKVISTLPLEEYISINFEDLESEENTRTTPDQETILKDLDVRQEILVNIEPQAEIQFPIVSINPSLGAANGNEGLEQKLAHELLGLTAVESPQIEDSDQAFQSAEITVNVPLEDGEGTPDQEPTPQSQKIGIQKDIDSDSINCGSKVPEEEYSIGQLHNPEEISRENTSFDKIPFVARSEAIPNDLLKRPSFEMAEEDLDTESSRITLQGIEEEKGLHSDMQDIGPDSEDKDFGTFLLSSTTALEENFPSDDSRLFDQEKVIIGNLSQELVAGEESCKSNVICQLDRDVLELDAKDHLKNPLIKAGPKAISETNPLDTQSASDRAANDQIESENINEVSAELILDGTTEDISQSYSVEQFASNSEEESEETKEGREITPDPIIADNVDELSRNVPETQFTTILEEEIEESPLDLEASTESLHDEDLVDYTIYQNVQNGFITTKSDEGKPESKAESVTFDNEEPTMLQDLSDVVEPSAENEPMPRNSDEEKSESESIDSSLNTSETSILQNLPSEEPSTRNEANSTGFDMITNFEDQVENIKGEEDEDEDVFGLGLGSPVELMNVKKYQPDVKELKLAAEENAEGEAEQATSSPTTRMKRGSPRKAETSRIVKRRSPDTESAQPSESDDDNFVSASESDASARDNVSRRVNDQSPRRSSRFIKTSNPNSLRKSPPRSKRMKELDEDQKDYDTPAKRKRSFALEVSTITASLSRSKSSGSKLAAVLNSTPLRSKSAPNKGLSPTLHRKSHTHGPRCQHAKAPESRPIEREREAPSKVNHSPVTRSQCEYVRIKIYAPWKKDSSKYLIAIPGCAIATPNAVETMELFEVENLGPDKELEHMDGILLDEETASDHILDDDVLAAVKRIVGPELWSDGCCELLHQGPVTRRASIAIKNKRNIDGDDDLERASPKRTKR